MLNDIFEEGYQKVRAEYAKEQDDAIRLIAEARGMPAEWLLSVQAVFIPNNDFMIEVFGTGILNYDCYRDGMCVWDNDLIFPVRNVNGFVEGFVGFDPFNYLDDENPYTYSSQDVMRKGNYLFYPKGNFEDAFNDGYLIVVDGVFDAISLCGAGFNAAAMLGSYVTDTICMQLRFIKKVILPADNDSAGYKLYTKLNKKLNNVILYKQGVTKDIDDYLKSSNRERCIDELQALIRNS